MADVFLRQSTASRIRIGIMNGNVVLNQTIFLMLSMVAETVFFTLGINDHKKKRLVFCFFLLKLLLVNWLFSLVLMPMYPESDLIHFLNFVANLVSLIGGCLFCVYVLSVSVSKLCLMLCISEVGAMTCTFVPVYLILLCQGKTMLQYQKQSPGLETLLHIVLSLVAVMAVRLLLRPYMKRLMESPNRHTIGGYLFLTLYVLSGFLVSVLGERGDKQKFIYPGVVTVIAFLVIIFAYMYIQYKQTQYLKLQNENLKLQKDLITEHYQALSNQIELTRKFRHDIANHMHTIENLLDQQANRDTQTDAYANALRERYHKLEEVDYCDNPVIDSAVSNKVKICKENDIPIHISLRRMELGKIEEMDLLALIFNLLDNAIESCTILPKEKRYIEFCCENCRGQMVITISNSACDAGERGELFRSKKKDKQYHGIGMTIVREIVKKYNGQMKITFAEPDFRLQIMLEC